MSGASPIGLYGRRGLCLVDGLAYEGIEEATLAAKSGRVFHRSSDVSSRSQFRNATTSRRDSTLAGLTSQ